MIKLFLVLKLFYLLLPKFVRNQYDDSVYYYKEIVLRILQKYKNTENTKSVINENLRLELVNNIEDLGCSYEVIFEKKNRESFINAPKIRIDNEDFYKSKLHNTMPDIYAYKLKNVSVVGHTDAVVFEDTFLHIELSFMEDFHDLKRPEIFSKLETKYYNVAVNYGRKKPLKEKKYISLLKEHSINYYHWTTEALPRLILIAESIKKKFDNKNFNDYILLVDDGLPKQCLDSIKIILQDDIEIYHVRKGEKYFCEELFYCTPLWHSLDNTTGLPNPKKEFFVDKFALELVRDTMIQNYDTTVPLYFENKKIYLQRLNNKLRPVANLNKVELLLFKYGFEFIDIGSLNLAEQIKLFQHADIIIGASGAAFTNLLYMKKNAKAINFYPSASATNYYVFQPLADVSEIDFTHFLTTPKEGEISVHAEVSVDLQNLETLLKEL